MVCNRFVPSPNYGKLRYRIELIEIGDAFVFRWPELARHHLTGNPFGGLNREGVLFGLEVRNDELRFSGVLWQQDVAETDF